MFFLLAPVVIAVFVYLLAKTTISFLLQAKLREIPALDKLRYLYCLLSSVLPVVKQIHQQQCAEVELEKKLYGNSLMFHIYLSYFLCIVIAYFVCCVYLLCMHSSGVGVDLERTKLNADEQMCWYRV